MKLPNAQHARVDRLKITEYLLSRSHPDGWGKAEFFEQFGFSLEQWNVLAEALRRHGQTHEVQKMVESDFGTRYSISGTLESPDGRNPKVLTVWIVEVGRHIPRLITAYPAEVQE